MHWICFIPNLFLIRVFFANLSLQCEFVAAPLRRPQAASMPGPMMFFAGPGLAAFRRPWGPAKKISPMEMGEILHEKIQLYIYKPSINR